MMPAPSATIVHRAYVSIFDPRVGVGHRYLFIWTDENRLEMLAAMLRQAFDRDHVLTPVLARDFTRRLESEGYFTANEIGDAWRDAHTEHLRSLQADVDAMDRHAAAFAYGNPNISPEQQSDARRRGLSPSQESNSADSGHGSAGNEARAWLGSCARFFVLVGPGLAVGSAMAWLVHWLGLWGN